MSRRTLGLLLLLVGLGIGAHAELAQAGSTVFGLFKVLVAGTEQASITGLNLPAGSTCDGGVCTVAGGGGAALADGGPDNAIVTANGTAGAIQVSLPTIDDTGNIGMPALATVDGRDLSVDGTKLDGLPAAAVSQAQVSPGDASIISGKYRGTGYVTAADAGLKVQACTVQLPLNSQCKMKVTWYGKQVGDAATGLTPTAGAVMSRWYTYRTNTTAIASSALVAAETDTNTITGSYIPLTPATDGAVAEPLVVGMGSPTHWACEVEFLSCNSI